jgi:diphosphomevalonate decarboxylase
MPIMKWKEKDFRSKVFNGTPQDKTRVAWRAPSNIALIKYWGKREPQLPMNPSLSFTLSKCLTETVVVYRKKSDSEDNIDFSLWFDGAEKPDFKPKISNFLDRIRPYVPWLTEGYLEIRTHNTFPHSSGIASSASGLSALALCLTDLELVGNDQISEFFLKKASFLARLGSGSACRSIEGPVVIWGEHDTMGGSSDLYGVVPGFSVHEIFEEYQDTILLVDKGQKVVSSTVGHELMNDHPFAESRFIQARQNFVALVRAMKTGELKTFVEVVEAEALSLHAMMLTSNPSFVLMKPGTLEIIHRIRKFRRDRGVPVCFTLDAGANVHLLYPKAHVPEVLGFVQDQLASFCQENNYICDVVGNGAVPVSG